jgi:hypothetical protein
MCYSYRTSIISYTFGMLSALFALCTKQIILGLFILCYCQMQLSEAIIWKGIDEKKTELNKKGTIYGKYLLATHNIAIGLGILIVSKKYSLSSILPLLISILFFLFITLYYYQNNQNYQNLTYPHDLSCNDKNCQNNNNRLQWPYPHEWYFYSFIISLIFCMIYINPLSSKLFLSSLFSITFIISLFYDSKKVGSIWCFSTAILSPIIVIINYYLINYF